MEKKPKLDHCVITVSDWERSNRFYRDVLGAELVPFGKSWVYRFGDKQLNVHGPNQPGDPNARIPVPAGGSDLCFEWPGAIEEAVAHLAVDGPHDLGERGAARGLAPSRPRR